MRIGSYNMLCFEGYPLEESTKTLGDMQDERRIAHFAAVIGSLECDILGMQEGQSVEHMRRVAHKLGVNLAAFPSSTRYCGGVYTRYPVLEVRTYSHCGLSARDGAYSRFGGAALLDVDGQRVWVVNIHTHPHKEELRVQEAAILSEKLNAILADRTEVIVTGDFNSRVGSVLHDTVYSHGLLNARELYSNMEPALAEKNGDFRRAIDHIYLSSGLAKGLENVKIVTESGFRLQGPPGPGLWANSDHVPVLADVNWPK